MDSEVSRLRQGNAGMFNSENLWKWMARGSTFSWRNIFKAIVLLRSNRETREAKTWHERAYLDTEFRENAKFIMHLLFSGGWCFQGIICHGESSESRRVKLGTPITNVMLSPGNILVMWCMRCFFSSPGIPENFALEKQTLKHISFLNGLGNSVEVNSLLLNVIFLHMEGK